MEYLRQVHWDAAQYEDETGYRGQFLYTSEDCLLIATLVPPGAKGPPRHRHPTDQIYLVLEGEITITLGEDTQKAAAGSIVFIPAGVPHHNWNEGAVNEFHLEVVAPGYVPYRPLFEPTDDVDTHGLPYFVRSINEPTTKGQGHTRQLISQAVCQHAEISLVESEAGHTTDLHVHNFLQFYFVTEGTLTVQIGVEHHDAEPYTLVCIPPGVPHRRSNDHNTTTHHLSITMTTDQPTGSPNQQKTLPVIFETV